jgi:hypothetical protein
MEMEGGLRGEGGGKGCGKEKKTREAWRPCRIHSVDRRSQFTLCRGNGRASNERYCHALLASLTRSVLCFLLCPHNLPFPFLPPSRPSSSRPPYGTSS